MTAATEPAARWCFRGDLRPLLQTGGSPVGLGGNRILRVAAGGSGGDGSSWALAFTGLDSALALAAQAGDVGQIWVAEGTYHPAHPNGFAMVDGVALYGGFAGTESSAFGRDPEAHPTILDGAGARHVLRAELTDGGSLDGFTITGGDASGDQGKNGGGAFFEIATRDSPPTVRNCRFVANRAEGFGGGLYVNRGTEVVGCLFLDNEAHTGGGLFMHAVGADHAVIAGCRLLRNGHDGGLSGGGGLEGNGNSGSDPLFIDADGPDDVAGTLDDNLRLAGSSPSRGAGNAALLGADVADMDGDGDAYEDQPVDPAGTTLTEGRVSQGAYE